MYNGTDNEHTMTLKETAPQNKLNEMVESFKHVLLFKAKIWSGQTRGDASMLQVNQSRGRQLSNVYKLEKSLQSIREQMFELCVPLKMNIADFESWSGELELPVALHASGLWRRDTESATDSNSKPLKWSA